MRVLRPAGQQGPQHPRRGGLAHRDAPGHAEQVGARHRGFPQETVGHPLELAAGGKVQIQQPREREIHLHHFVERELIVETLQLGQVGLRQRQGSARAEPRPLGAAEVGIGGESHRSNLGGTPFSAGLGCAAEADS